MLWGPSWTQACFFYQHEAHDEQGRANESRYSQTTREEVSETPSVLNPAFNLKKRKKNIPHWALWIYKIIARRCSIWRSDPTSNIQHHRRHITGYTLHLIPCGSRSEIISKANKLQITEQNMDKRQEKTEHLTLFRFIFNQQSYCLTFLTFQSQ